MWWSKSSGQLGEIMATSLEIYFLIKKNIEYQVFHKFFNNKMVNYCLDDVWNIDLKIVCNFSFFLTKTSNFRKNTLWGFIGPALKIIWKFRLKKMSCKKKKKT